MWYSSVSLMLAIAIGMQRLQGVFFIEISFDSEDLTKNADLSFEEPMDNCDDPNNQNVVRLNQMSLTIVTKDFVKSPDVRFITLENNQIFEISVDAFRSVPNLTCLNIRNNRINGNYLLTFRHDNLLKLNLANNEIMYISDTQWNGFLPRLTHLDLSGNNIIKLPSITDFRTAFPNLTHFYFSENSFIGELFHYLPPLTQHIYLERSINEISMDYLPYNLTALYISENILQYSSYITFPNLGILSMRKCENVLNIISEIETPNLIELDLSSNDLRSLPINLFTDKEILQRLSLENNTLSTFPVLDKIHLLTDLSLNFNNITNITVQFIGHYNHLKRLYLRGNRISMIEVNAFSTLHYLKKLDLAENQLTTLPSLWISSLSALSHLDLRSNLFNTIDDMSVNVYMVCIKHLYLGKNKFTRIDMSSLTKINSYVTIHVL